MVGVKVTLISLSHSLCYSNNTVISIGGVSTFEWKADGDNEAARSSNPHKIYDILFCAHKLLMNSRARHKGEQWGEMICIFNSRKVKMSWQSCYMLTLVVWIYSGSWKVEIILYISTLFLKRQRSALTKFHLMSGTIMHLNLTLISTFSKIISLFFSFFILMPSP